MSESFREVLTELMGARDIPNVSRLATMADASRDYLYGCLSGRRTAGPHLLAKLTTALALDDAEAARLWGTVGRVPTPVAPNDRWIVAREAWAAHNAPLFARRTREMLAALDGAVDETLFASLTPAQWPVFLGRCYGLSDDEIAEALGISRNAVHRHRDEIMVRLGMNEHRAIFLYGRMRCHQDSAHAPKNSSSSPVPGSAKAGPGT